ncbi:MAG: SDR family NAD(P)-dependent oxidoreductase [Bacteroidales bacterium]|nr:SDR family NAD(P)-dependent oxidoreductase [Bacteroidales bacterium]
MKEALIIGGANGIGLSIALEMACRSDVKTVHIVDKQQINNSYLHPKFKCYQCDLSNADFSFFDQFIGVVDTLFYTAGFGKLALFADLDEDYIIDSFNVNTLAAIRVIKRFFPCLTSQEKQFYCGVMVSIAGFMSSPFFSVYAATKAALKIFIESVNVELEKTGSKNRILNVSPGLLKGTSFYGEPTNLDLIKPMAQAIITELERGNDLFIPQYDAVFHDVLERYHTDFRAEGRQSYDYKIVVGRVAKKNK